MVTTKLDNVLVKVANRMFCINIVPFIAYVLAANVTRYNYVMMIATMYMYIMIKIVKYCCLNTIRILEKDECRAYKYENILLIICIIEVLFVLYIISKLFM
jgi:hypothetical protein